MIEPSIFQTLLLSWFRKYGRKQLPWQMPRTPYRVWISEIMLQQTQVATVIPYFERFMETFPTITHLAEAEQDSVLYHWAGLGYYARARNLHRTAQIVTSQLNRELPNDLKTLQSLPGIGRSTAGAILSLGYNQPAAILDGNVKRVLCRLHAIPSWPGITATHKQLWKLSEQYMSLTHPADYTQAIMDFGSLICIRHQPYCAECPFTSSCIAYQTSQVGQYPAPKPIQDRIIRKAKFLILVNSNGDILLEKRPSVGVWGGLWSIPECNTELDVNNWCKKQDLYLHLSVARPSVLHSFTHFQLEIQPILCYVEANPARIIKESARGWFAQTDIQHKGLPAPIKKLLQNIFNERI
jgi:A/G-specific adenine glycosylase